MDVDELLDKQTKVGQHVCGRAAGTYKQWMAFTAAIYMSFGTATHREIAFYELACEDSSSRSGVVSCLLCSNLNESSVIKVALLEIENS